MDQIFSLENGSKIAIYAWENSIWVNTLPLPLKAQPMSITNDYAGMLNSCIHEGNIYYIYRNTENNLLVGNLTTGLKIEVLKDEALIFRPLIYGFLSDGERHLLAVVALQNPLDNTFSIELLVISPKFQKIVIVEKIHHIVSVNVHSVQGDIYIHLEEKTDNEETRSFLFLVQEKVDRGNAEYSVQELPITVSVQIPCSKCPQWEEKVLQIKNKYNTLVETTKKIQEEGKRWKQLYEETLY